MYRRPGLVCRDHLLTVPLDHSAPTGAQIQVFAREVVSSQREHDDLPWLLYLQGGPGNKANRPVPTSPWLRRALTEYRVLLLDQRGTGRSTPATRQTLAGMSPVEQAGYLGHFRADSIVRDAELLRRHLLGEDGRWTVLGQSFGGFCATTYLSLAPEALDGVVLTGGLPPLHADAEQVYRALYPRVLAKNKLYFRRYPGDEELADRVVRHLRRNEVVLPDGARLSVERFLSLGIDFGAAARFDGLHYLLEEAFLGEELSETFVQAVVAATSFATRPLYAVLHEATYCQGGASRWAADRVRAEFAEFDAEAGQVRFTGEMIYPWMFEQDPALVPLRAAADLLAERADWPHLYDPDRLARNEVPVVAALYHEDMYVDRDFSLETAEAIRGTRTWVTNEYEHDGLAANGAVLDRLLSLLHGHA
ncbi:alpha/beta fold hydrolase [Kutzneria albida]|uniref:Proline iminopeptidase n=1 Tax=Kutzneria albida DSM 43870 TaxID=1449976 RepID=W5WET9_9PSEU|nr:alpha/beta fold hydrolase [Kutzneria albida]AHH96659.1 Proline iminopeptidase [Kutzneria albida DSM 43870]